MKWNKFRDTVKHAFAVKVEEPLTAEEKEMLDRLARFIVRRRLSAPAVFFCRTMTPLSYVGSQAMWVLQPMAELFISPKDFLAAQKLLERREGIDMLLDRIEHLEQKKENSEEADSKTSQFHQTDEQKG